MGYTAKFPLREINSTESRASGIPLEMSAAVMGKTRAALIEQGIISGRVDTRTGKVRPTMLQRLLQRASPKRER